MAGIRTRRLNHRCQVGIPAWMRQSLGGSKGDGEVVRVTVRSGLGQARGHCMHQDTALCSPVAHPPSGSRSTVRVSLSRSPAWAISPLPACPQVKAQCNAPGPGRDGGRGCEDAAIGHVEGEGNDGSSSEAWGRMRGGSEEHPAAHMASSTTMKSLLLGQAVMTSTSDGSVRYLNTRQPTSASD